MARGWESKSVESQQGDSSQQPAGGKKPADQIEREQRRHALEMSRRRIVSELAATKSEMRRKSLQAALEHLDRELAKL